MFVFPMYELMGCSIDGWDSLTMNPASYLVDRGGPSGVRKAKRAAQKRRNVRARSKK